MTLLALYVGQFCICLVNDLLITGGFNALQANMTLLRHHDATSTVTPLTSLTKYEHDTIVPGPKFFVKSASSITERPILG